MNSVKHHVQGIERRFVEDTLRILCIIPVSTRIVIHLLKMDF